MKNLIASLLVMALASITIYAAGVPKLALDGQSENGLFNLLLYPQQGEPVIGEYHHWIIELKDKHDKPIDNAVIGIGGGMAAHGHGLPSQPVVTDYLGEGKYLVEGLLFNMAGDWTLLVAVKKGQFSDRAEFEMKLEF